MTNVVPLELTSAMEALTCAVVTHLHQPYPSASQGMRQKQVHYSASIEAVKPVELLLL